MANTLPIGNGGQQFDMQDNNTQTAELVRLPLWRSCLESMIEDGLSHGKVFDSGYFEERLKCNRDSMRFGLDLAKIRRELEGLGFYLSGRGQNGNQFVILPPENNADVLLQYQRAAVDALKRGVILGTNTRIDLLSDGDRRRHEAVLERICNKSALMARSQQILAVVKQHKPNLLAQ